MSSRQFQTPVWDLSLLPAASIQFLVVTDTHFILPDNAQAAEWSSVGEFPVRTERALRMAAALPRDFAVHLGDISHEYPETGRADVAQEGALAQFASLGLDFHQAAGNMDIGDKPDRTSPAQWVTPETLAGWHSRVSRSWHSFDAGDIHGIVLNTQIMNGPLPEAAEQIAWAEADLAANADRRILLFLHMPVFYVDRHEHSTGFYNSLDEPARSWVLGLVENYGIEWVFSGHTHTVEINRHGAARLWTVPSTATSRAGLAEAYALVPPDRGRGDVDKLAFYFLRETERGMSAHHVRTGRDTEAMRPGSAARQVMTCTSRDLPARRVGLFATHPLGHANPGPVIWPSIVRQPVRDDFRLASVLELGAGFLRFPAFDLSTPSEASRLQILRDEGVALSPYWVWSDHLDLVAAVAPHRAVIDSVEVVLPGTTLPEISLLDAIRSLQNDGLPVTLAPAIVEQSDASQYHQRTRVGYRPADIPALDAFLATHDLTIHRLACRLPHRNPGAAIDEAAASPGNRFEGIDWYLDLASEDDEINAGLVAEAMLRVSAHPSMRIVLGPHADFDRSMDATNGLIDRLSNPRPPFVVARMLNSLLFREDADSSMWVFPGGAGDLPAAVIDRLSTGEAVQIYDLARALSWEVTSLDGASEILAGIGGPSAIDSRATSASA
ncbi:MAG: metallophosphoesterase [Thermomicrobiales bacterium]|nr:metallophosphoesterase [Thermomicrobiales bacterium]